MIVKMEKELAAGADTRGARAREYAQEAYDRIFSDPDMPLGAVRDALAKAYLAGAIDAELGQWTLMSAAAPRVGGEYLCALQYGHTIEYQVMSYFPRLLEWYGGGDDDNANHIVAWMRIPQPPL